MATGVLAFRADLAKWSEKMDRDIATLLRYVTLDIYNLITERNPVDTGYSRSQWRIGIGEPDTSVDAPPKRGGKDREVISAPIADAGALRELTKESVTFVTNSVNYIQYLEEGSSDQAPNGMIRIALAIAESRVDTYRGE